MNTDTLRALVMAVVTSFLNMLVLVGVVSLSAEALGAINLFIGNLVLLAAYLYKPSNSGS